MVTRNIIKERCTPVVRITGIVAGYILLILSVLITYDVIARAVFNVSIGTTEFGGYAVAIVAAFGFAVALLERDHIRIDIFYRLMPTSLRVVSNLLSTVALFLFAGFIAWRSWATLQQSYEFGSAATTGFHTPQWIPQLVWFFGLATFAILALVHLIHSVSLILRGRLSDSMSFYGPPSLSEEIQQGLVNVEGLDDDSGEASTSDPSSNP